jgi:thioredoxin 1
LIKTIIYYRKLIDIEKYENLKMKRRMKMAALKITKENFNKEVMESDVPVLLDFWAPWCGPCRMVGPIIDQLSDEVEGVAKVGKVNVDEQVELASAFRVTSIPTLAVVKDGKVTSIQVGARNKGDMKKMLGL